MSSNSDLDTKRVFFGLEMVAPWPLEFPHGRLLDEEFRHITLAFLGRIHYPTLKNILSSFPSPPFKVGLVGQFNQCLLLPKRHHPNVIAWHAEWLEEQEALKNFQKILTNWLIQQAVAPLNSEREFLPHVTLCRKPFIATEWLKAFTSLPFMTKDIHLYESLGHSQYRSLWHYPIKAPFEEIEHTADIAFRIRGKNLEQLHLHAQIALAFKCPTLLSFFSNFQTGMELEDIIIDLNEMITKVDAEHGSPFKAISFHDKLIEEEPNLLVWEMIVDV